MSALMNQARNRVPRIAEAAVERARLTVVPRAPGRSAARVPFVVLVSLLLVGGVAGLLCFNTSMQQASFTSTAMEEQAAGARREAAVAGHGARRAARPAAGGGQGPAHGHGPGDQPGVHPALRRQGPGQADPGHVGRLAADHPAADPQAGEPAAHPDRRSRPSRARREDAAGDGAASADDGTATGTRRPTTAPASRGASVDPGQPPPSRRTTSGTSPPRGTTQQRRAGRPRLSRCGARRWCG